MTKEEIFKALTGLILDLRDQQETRKFEKNPTLWLKWKKLHAQVQEEVARLSPSDNKWLTEYYAIWYKRNLEPIVKQLRKSK